VKNCTKEHPDPSAPSAQIGKITVYAVLNDMGDTPLEMLKATRTSFAMCNLDQCLGKRLRQYVLPATVYRGNIHSSAAEAGIELFSLRQTSSTSLNRVNGRITIEGIDEYQPHQFQIRLAQAGDLSRRCPLCI
jgi:hypothetical protein